MAAKTTTKKTAKRSAVSAAMKQTAAEDKERAEKRGTAGDGDTVPAKAPTAARVARGRKKAGKAPAKPKAATQAKDAPQAATPKTKGKPAPKAAKPKRLSALDAAAQVLAANGGEMSAREMVKAMTEQKLWSSPAGKTPDATLYSAVIREIGAKGKDSRFKKTARGRFASNGKRD